MTKGSNPGAISRQMFGTSDDEIDGMITIKVSAKILQMNTELFESIKTQMISIFDERHVAYTEAVVVAAIVVVVVAGPAGNGSVSYCVFNHMKPPQVDGIKDLIYALIWICDVEG